MAEIDDAQLQTLQAAYTLLNGLYSSPKHGNTFKRLIKEAHPNASIPEIDAAAPYVERLESFEKKFDDYLTKQEERKQDDEFNTAIRRLRESGFTDDGIEAVKKLMVERKIPDPEAAAALFEKQNPAPVEPSTVTPPTWDLSEPAGDEESAKLLMEDEDAWGDREAARVLQELKQGA